ncbi:MAG TPA: insulinase family protein [Treponemataceae bacterium]|nr:insulinase family protein [Treponemataceae bacterium]
MIKRFAYITVAVLFFFTACETAAPVLTAGRELVTDERISTGTLENGVSWMVMENNEPQNRIQLRLVVRAGSVPEDDDQRGIAHLVEHMAFKGTKSFAKEDLVDYFETIGMAFGPEVNAYTSFDETVYKLEIPADDPAILARSMAILREWADSLVFDPAELEKERSIVIEEWRQGLGANQRVRDRQIPLLFRGMAYADRLPIGDPEIVRTVSRERIMQFYRDWYRPELMTVIAVGDASAEILRDHIAETFSAIPASVSPRGKPETGSPVHTGRDVLLVRDPEITYTTAQILQHHDMQPLKTVNDYRRRLIEAMAFSVLNSRLSEKALASDPVFLAAEAGSWQLIPDMRFSWIWTAPSPEKFSVAFEEAMTELERMKRHGITESELERQKTTMLEQMRKAWLDRDKVSSAAHTDALVHSVLYSEPYLSLDARNELYRTLVPGISSGEVQQVLQDLYPGRGTLLFVTAPENAADIPDEAALAALWEKAGTGKELAAYEEADLGRPLYPPELLAERGHIVGRKELSDDGIVQLDLSNGATVIIHPTDFRENEVLFTAYSRGGTSLVSDGDFPSASAAVDYVEYSGLNGFDPVSLQKKLSSNSVSVTPWIEESYEGLSGNSSAEDLEILFQLTALYFVRPEFTETGWSALMAQLRTLAANRRSKPDEQFNDMIRDILYGDAKRFHNLDMERVAAMDPSVAERIYRERFAGADDFVFVFTGSVSVEQVVSFAEQYLAILPAVGKKEDASVIRPPFPEGSTRRTLQSGLEPKSTVFVGFGGDAVIRDYDFELFSQFRLLLDLRLREAIREALGGSYGVWVGGILSGYPDGRFALQFQFGCEPGREEELTLAVLAELSALREKPVAETDLVKLQEKYRRSRESGLQNNRFWHSRLVQVLMREEPISVITDTDSMLTRITAETLREQARRYINPDNHISGWLLPADQTLREEGQPAGEPVPAAP